MENRSHALLAGIFTLVLLFAAAATAFWLGRDRGDRAIYALITTSPVNGLSVQSPVRYQGVPVGRVADLRLDRERPGAVRVLIDVAANTPVSAATWAEIGVRGVTGAALVDLRDDGSAQSRLATSKESPAEIPIRAGTFQKLEERGTAIFDSAERIMRQMTRLTSDENLRHVQTATASMAALAQSLQASAQAMEPVVRKAGPLLDALTRTAAQADAAARDIAALTRSTRAAIERLQAKGGPLDMTTRSMHELTVAVARMNQDLTPRLTGMAEDVGGAARGIDRTLQSMRDRPQSLLFGPAPVRPGPGEAGFQGFGGR